MLKVETDSGLIGEIYQYLEKDSQNNFGTAMHAEKEKPYNFQHFVRDAQELVTIDQQGLSPDQMTETTRPIIDRTIDYALGIINLTNFHQQRAMQKIFSMEIASRPEINPDSLQGKVNDLLGAALDLAIFRRTGEPGFDRNGFNKEVSNRLGLKQIPRGGPMPAAKK